MREALLEAALVRFVAAGVVETSLDAIRREAGASVGSLYHAFPGGKSELTAALYVETLGQYQHGFLVELGRARDAQDGIGRIVRFHLRWHTRHPKHARFLHATREPELRAATDAPLRKRNAAFFGDVRAWLGPHVEAGALRDASTPLLHALWLGPAQELCRHWLAGAARAPDRRTADTLADAAWKALRTDPSPEGAMT